MSGKIIDLYLGSDLGLWSLRRVKKESIGQIFTLDNDIAAPARKLGAKVWLGDANSIDFSPSEVGFSVHYPRILNRKLISRYGKMYNLHPGYLPWGRGYYPIFWALWEETPAGATLHEINAGVDKGPIVSQTRVEYYPSDTGGSLFRRVRKAEKDLFLKYWPRLVGGEEIPAFPQPRTGSYHSRREFFELQEEVAWKTMKGRDLVKLVRCLTFTGYPGLEVGLGEKKFELRLKERGRN